MNGDIVKSIVCYVIWEFITQQGNFIAENQQYRMSFQWELVGNSIVFDETKIVGFDILDEEIVRQVFCWNYSLDTCRWEQLSRRASSITIKTSSNETFLLKRISFRHHSIILFTICFSNSLISVFRISL